MKGRKLMTISIQRYDKLMTISIQRYDNGKRIENGRRIKRYDNGNLASHSSKQNLTEDISRDGIRIRCDVRDEVGVRDPAKNRIEVEGTQSGMALKLEEFILDGYASNRDSRIVWTIQGFGDFTLQEFLQLPFVTTLDSAMLSRREYWSDEYYEDHVRFWVKNRLQDNLNTDYPSLDYYVYHFTNFDDY
jgi:hypothetical protein